jgi:hypothetical protein
MKMLADSTGGRYALDAAYAKRIVADEAKTPDLLHATPESANVGTLAEA